MSPHNHHLSATGKPPPEKSNSRFLHTCNRLSLFLKEKGNIRDLNFEIHAKFDHIAKGIYIYIYILFVTSFNCFSSIYKISIMKKTPQMDKSTSINHLPQYVTLDSSCEPVTNAKTEQMTIFYEGQVLVLDDVSADRARDLMLMAKNGGIVKKVENRIESKARVDVSGSKEASKAVVQGKDSDLPIARRASLHKFLTKRKDRATVRAPAPFQEHNQAPGGSSSGNEHSFDLNM
ncbi:protein TIFY 11B-like [Bidens hawaiensis]|uniref:protein TIFY 11B-like n=1 Tax=Bidens hawaiensis TaxID=980011 RepID=UPI00404A99CB